MYFCVGLNQSCMKKETLKIKEVVRLSPEAVQLSFDIPSAIQEEFRFQAGQYLTLGTTINGENIRRSYSICTAPHEEDLAVGIKALPKGIFSNHAQDLTAGDLLEVSIPEGRFTYQPIEKKQLGIAAGSGITPLMSILKTHLKNDPSHEFCLVYGNKSPEKTLFYNELLALEKECAGRLQIHWIFSQSSEEGAGFGRIDAAFLKHVLKGKTNQPTYICGPEEMIHLSKDTLLGMGYAQEQILFELFFSSTTEATPVKDDGAGQLEIICDGETHVLELSGESVLDAALKHKIDVPYSCQGGVCSSCIAKVTTGKARMEQNQILTDSEVAEGLVLTCQAYAETPKIVVDFDDV